jgi:hypothetical protein
LARKVEFLKRPDFHQSLSVRIRVDHIKELDEHGRGDKLAVFDNQVRESLGIVRKTIRPDKIGSLYNRAGKGRRRRNARLGIILSF